MTDERDKAIGELRQQVGGIDPVLDQAASYGRAINETRKLARAQGQVMSAALENNHTLYHTNKELKRRLDEAERTARSASENAAALRARLGAAYAYATALEACGGDKFRPLYERARETLQRHLFDTLTPDELGERLADMKRQAEQIKSDPSMLTPEEIAKLKEDTGYEAPTPELVQ